MKLPPQPWLSTSGARRIFAALDAAGGHVRPVGGAVRDALLGLPVSDVDLATDWLPADVVRRLQAGGIKTVPTGIAHGTITAVVDGEVIEITTLRRDVTTDGRHAEVAFSDDWREDAARRDFTINALYVDPISLEISDFFGGLADLDERRVRFIGEPLRRIAEDHLRILRFFRFHARFGRGEPDAEGLAACTTRANDLMALSRERIRDEISKLLAVADPVPVIRTMLAAGVLAPVLPEAQDINRLERLVAAEAQTTPHWLRRLAALLPADAAMLDEVAARLKLSNHDRKRLVAMGAPSTGNPMEEAYWDGAAAVTDRLLLAGAPAERFAGLVDWVRPKLPITGRVLIARGMAAGPAVSLTLGAIERRWAANGFPADVSNLIDEALAAPVSGIKT
ncbi:CCA tRNA nucleotidyltransferase [Glacieibacterium sp.]|uniref:CCA tRNA nucleotidyltransferase n=1 Tax=Glacieibacterium sp. TaxID=2860237 RepID=UPI003AFFF36F